VRRPCGGAALVWVGLIGIVPIATALMRFCPLYTVLGVRTSPMAKDAK
jgi:hypothetical protein